MLITQFHIRTHNAYVKKESIIKNVHKIKTKDKVVHKFKNLILKI